VKGREYLRINENITLSWILKIGSGTGSWLRTEIGREYW
jgi:hypothetical protein